MVQFVMIFEDGGVVEGTHDDPNSSNQEIIDSCNETNPVEWGKVVSIVRYPEWEEMKKKRRENERIAREAFAFRGEFDFSFMMMMLQDDEDHQHRDFVRNDFKKWDCPGNGMYNASEWWHVIGHDNFRRGHFFFEMPFMFGMYYTEEMRNSLSKGKFANYYYVQG